MHHFSNRLPWFFSSNILSQLANEKRLHDPKLLDLTVSNPTEALASYPHSAIASAFGSVPDFFYQPEAAGKAGARETVSAYYAARNAFVDPADLLLTASTSEAYSALFKLLCDPHDEVLIPVPSYPLFEYLAALDAVRTVPYRLAYDGSWFIDFPHLLSRISARTRAIVVVSPNNPTGSFLKADEAARLLELNLPIICDEVFLDYPLAQSSIPTLAGRNDALVFSLNGLSKSAGMPQMKLGWIAISGSAEDKAAARSRLELILDTYLSVGTPVQEALPQLLTIGAGIRQQLQAQIAANLRTAHRLLDDTAAHCLHAEAGWSAIIQVPRTRSEDEWVLALLRDSSTLVQPGYFFDMAAEAYLVVSLITAPEILAAGLSALREHVTQA